MRQIVLLISILSLLGILLTVAYTSGHSVAYQYGDVINTSDQATAQTSTSSKLFVVGDVFLGRAVERILDTHGLDYSYKQLDGLWSTEDVVLANFEAAIPTTHTPTPDFGFQFSVRSDIAAQLVSHGFTHVSLANNHSYDFGRSGYRGTKEALAQTGLQAWGDVTAGTSSVTYVEQGGISIALVALTTVGIKYNDAVYTDLVRSAKDQADYVLVYIHWGTEYERTSNVAQQTLAHDLITAGASTIVGHHPHVVQEIGWYDGVPIFYSLGNFIFDQYFSADVQEGLMLAIDFSDTSITYTLHPVTSILSRSQPRLMSSYERDIWLEDLAKRSDEKVQSAITSGTLHQSRP